MPSISANVNSISCNGQNDGSINLTVSGGVLPVTYLWSNGSTNEDLNNLSSGIYSVVVTDNLGFSDSASFTISEPDLFVSDYVVIDASGIGINDGAIYSFASGGTTMTILAVLIWKWYYPNFVDIPAGSLTYNWC